MPSNNPYAVDQVDLSGLQGISKLGDRVREGNRREKFAGEVSKALADNNYEELDRLKLEYPALGKGITDACEGSERISLIY